MKKILVLTLVVGSAAFSYAQEEPSKNLPPIKTLPKDGEVKQIYELPEEAEYALFDQLGNLLSKGKGQFIDYTKFEKGTYFVQYNGKTEKFIKE